MNISGVLIAIDPDKREAAITALNEFEGLEIHHTLDDGKVVAVLERENTKEEVKAIRKIYDIDGVLSAVMAYHHFEDETGDPSEPVPALGQDSKSPFPEGWNQSPELNNNPNSN